MEQRLEAMKTDETCPSTSNYKPAWMLKDRVVEGLITKEILNPKPFSLKTGDLKPLNPRVRKHPKPVFFFFCRLSVLSRLPMLRRAARALKAVTTP